MLCDYVYKLFTQDDHLPLQPEDPSIFRVKVLIDNYSERERALLRVMYWAAAFGKAELVEALIAKGLSPFLGDSLRRYEVPTQSSISIGVR
jgi:hypothetical protein